MSYVPAAVSNVTKLLVMYSKNVFCSAKADELLLLSIHLYSAGTCWAHLDYFLTPFVKASFVKASEKIKNGYLAILCLSTFPTKRTNKLRLTSNFPVPLKKPTNTRSIREGRIYPQFRIMKTCQHRSTYSPARANHAWQTLITISRPSSLSPRRPWAAGPPDWLLRRRLQGCELRHSGLMDSVAPQQEALGCVCAWQSADAAAGNRRSTGAGALTKLIIWTNDGRQTGSAHFDTSVRKRSIKAACRHEDMHACARRQFQLQVQWKCTQSAQTRRFHISGWPCEK